MSPLVTLALVRQRGRFRKWLRMLRQPKYAVGMLVIGSYWGWLLVSRVATGGPGRPPMDPDAVAALRLAGALALAALLTIGYLLRSRQPLVFDEAEIQHLFPAPVARRALIRYALLKVQPGIILGSAISTLILKGGSLADRLQRWPSIWLTFTLMFLASNAMGLWKTRIEELPDAQARRRRIATWAAIAGGWALVGALAFRAWTDVAAASAGTFEGGIDDLRRIADVLRHERVLHVVLAPLEMPLQSVLAASLAERAAGWASALVLAVALLEGCARTPVRFEEGAIERARQVSEIRTRGLGASARKALSPKARARRPFRLAAAGAPEAAIVWKNLLLVARTSALRAVTIGAAVLAVALTAIALLHAPMPLVVTVVSASLSLALIAPISGGMVWRNDLRVDLLHLDQLRTWPIPASRLIAAEIAAPAIVTAASCLFLVSLGLGTVVVASIFGDPGSNAMAVLAEGLETSRIGAGIWGLLGAVPLIVALSFLSSSIQNATVLLMPGWSRLGRHAVQGAAVAGQQILLSLARGLVLAAGLVPGAVLVTIVVLAQAAVDQPVRAWELPLLGLLAAAPLAVESLLIVLGCARLWARLDPSRELLENESA